LKIQLEHFGFKVTAAGGILAAGHVYQQQTDWHLKRPPL